MLPAIRQAPNATLVATASRSGDVPDAWADTDVGSYEAVLEHPDVEAVYIPLPNGMHQEWTEKAAAVGKHLLVEKPLASDSATARAMAATCADAGVILAEAWMTPFHHRYVRVLDDAEWGLVGPLEHIDATFTFTIGPEAADNYRWDPDQGGGALLDVGIYCLGAIVELFGMPTEVRAEHELTDRGVDAWTTADMTWPDRRSASIRCSFVDEEVQTLRLVGSTGQVLVTDEAFTGRERAESYTVSDKDGDESYSMTANDSYQSMVEAFAAAVRGEAEWPRPVVRSIEMLQLIERIKDAARD